MKDLKGKTAAITGAGSGLGRAMALAFAREGMKLALADVDQKGLDETVSLLGERPLFSMRVDVSKEADVEGFAKRIEKPYLVCNNAGVSTLGAAWEQQRRRLAVDPRRQPVGRDPRRARLRAAPDRAGRGPHRQHRLGAGPHLAAGLGRLQRHQARRGDVLGNAATRPARAQLARSACRCCARRTCRPGSPTPNGTALRAFHETHLSEKSKARSANLKKAVASGKLSADDVAKAVVAAVKEDRFYILTHPRIKGAIQARMEDILNERAPRDPMRLG